MPSGDVELAWAVKDDLVVIGSGPDFVKHVLDTTDGHLARRDGRYKDLAGPRRRRQRDHLRRPRRPSASATEGAHRGDDPSALKTYETEVKPFLAPFDAFVASSSVGGDLDQLDAIITVK